MEPTRSGNYAEKSHTQTHVRPNARGVLQIAISYPTGTELTLVRSRTARLSSEICACSVEMTKTYQKDIGRLAISDSERTVKLKMSIHTKLSPMQLDLYVKQKCWIGDSTSAFNVHMNMTFASCVSVTLHFKNSLPLVSSVKKVSHILEHESDSRSKSCRNVKQNEP